MRSILIPLCFLLPICARAQHPTLVNDTITYNNTRITVGDTLHLGYGSSSNKDFVFVFYGSGMSGVNPAQAVYAKSDLLVDKVYKTQGIIYARCKIINPQSGFKMFINIEGAIDNNELKITP
jgi:hypothetical protein